MRIGMNIELGKEYIVKTGKCEKVDGGVPMEVHGELVRCRDCEYGYLWQDDGTGAHGKCAFLIGDNQYVPADGYCYLGERREE